MKLTFCGAAGTTTGSQHLLEVNDKRILLDCGLFQGRRHESYERNRHFLYNPAELDAVILSHAHIDHSGNLPNLVKQGYNGNIYATFATRDLCQIMLADSARIQQADIAFINRKRAKRNEPPFHPIYTEMEAEASLRQFVTLGYNRALPIADGVYLTFIDAGHILGSAQVLLDIDERDSGRRSRFLFSGDVGRGSNALLNNSAHAADVDYLLMESTYGGREHERSSDARRQLARIINEALERRGKIIIPAFAVERTQQLLYAFNDLFESGDIPVIPIFVDSPLAVSATEIFRLHPECFNEEVYRFLFEKRNPFGFESLTLIRSVRQSMELNELEDSCVIIASSGMCEAGRVLHHLKNNIARPDTTLLFVGYCAEHTLGWKIRNGFKNVRIFGESHQVRAHVEILDSFSGHADHSELVDYFNHTGGPKQNTWLVHGEPERCEALRLALTEQHPSGTISIGHSGESVTF